MGNRLIYKRSRMAAKLLECLAVDGNYSKARIGALLLAIFSIAYFIWLIVLTVNMSKIDCKEKPNSDSTGWSIISETKPTCGSTPMDRSGNVKDKAECDKKASENNATRFIWFAHSEKKGKKPYCALFKTCLVSESKFSSIAAGTTFMKDANGEFNVIVGKMDRERCAEKENNRILQEPDVFYQECTERAIKEDAKFMMYAEAFTLKTKDGKAEKHKSLCELYKECTLEKLTNKEDTKTFVQPFTI